MQEVFEKIIERMREELKMADEEKLRCAGENPMQFDSAKGYSHGVGNAIEIVKQEAVKFATDTNVWSNGWIPVSERLPNEAYGCLVTVMDCEPSTQTEFENILPYFVGYDGETWNDADGEEIPFEVIAWQKLPRPYQPKGE